jgi:hypothetical protein
VQHVLFDHMYLTTFPPHNIPAATTRWTQRGPRNSSRVTGLSCRSSTSGGGQLPSAAQRMNGHILLHVALYTPHVILFLAETISWAQRGQPTFQLAAGHGCKSSILRECCMTCEARLIWLHAPYHLLFMSRWMTGLSCTSALSRGMSLLGVCVLSSKK